MIKKVFIGESSDVRFLVEDQFNPVKFINCEGLKSNEFITLHQPSLFNQVITCCLNVDEADIEDEILLNIISTAKSDVIWTFKSLRKNGKVFKKLSSCSNIQSCDSLDRTQLKKDFIRQQLSSSGLPLRFLEKLVVDGSEDRSILKNEIAKLSELFKVSKDDSLVLKSVCKYNGSLDTLEFLSNLLNNDVKMAFNYANKIANEVSALVISATLLKKIKAMIYLSLGDITSANTIWRHGGYFLDQAIRQSKSIGTKGLISLYEYVDINFSNPMNHKDLHTRLSELILYFDRQKFKQDSQSI